MVSASRRVVDDTNKPKDMQVEIISATEISIMVANSLTVTNSVSLRILFPVQPAPFRPASSGVRHLAYLRCLELLVFPLFPKTGKRVFDLLFVRLQNFQPCWLSFSLSSFIFFLLSSCLAVLEASNIDFLVFFSEYVFSFTSFGFI